MFETFWTPLVLGAAEKLSIRSSSEGENSRTLIA